MHLQLLVLQKTEGTVVKPATFHPSLRDFIDVPDSDTRKIQQFSLAPRVCHKILISSMPTQSLLTTSPANL